MADDKDLGLIGPPGAIPDTTPLADEPGAHPVGTGHGATTGGTNGGMLGGLLGAVIGAAVGGLVGGLAGKGVAESINPTEEDAFWRTNYSSRPYAAERSYNEIQPAYRYGWESRSRYADRSWSDAEGDLEREWESAKGTSRLNWHEAKDAVRDAWHRVERARPGDADFDGR